MIELAKTGGPLVLTIAGFDPSGGAGTIADVQTLVQFGVRPVAAITSLTFQNSETYFGAIHETADSIRAQILPVVEEERIAAVKIGMLPTAEIVTEVARLIAEADLPAPVIDPVMRSTSGYDLVEPEAIDALISELIPLARLLTPNISETEVLTGQTITNEEEMRLAAAALRALDLRAVLIKGGHLGAPANSVEQKRVAVDVLDDEGEVTVLSHEWIDAPNRRGTGCMLSSAIAAGLAQEKSLVESVRDARSFVADAIRQARNF